MSMTKALGDAVGAIGKLNGGITKLHPGLAALSLAVDGLKAVMNVTAKYAERNLQINERLLVLGTTQIDFFNENKEALLSNTASIDDQMRVAAEMRAAGFEQFNKEQVNLAANMKMTGQNTKAALDLFAGLERNTTLTTAQQESLAKAINDTSITFGRAAESIVAAVDKLDTEAMTKFGVEAGALSEMFAEMAGSNQMAAELGVQFTNSLMGLAQSEGGMAGLGFTDIMADFEALTAGGGSPEELRDMAQKVVTQIGNSVEGMPTAIRMGVQGQLPGADTFLAATQFLDQFDKNVRGPTDKSFQDTLAAEKARATRQAEVNAATITGFRQLKELSIVGNAFLESIATDLGAEIFDGIGEMGTAIAEKLGLTNDYIQHGNTDQARLADAAEEQVSLAERAANEAAAARLQEQAANDRMQLNNSMLQQAIGFEPGTAVQEAMLLFAEEMGRATDEVIAIRREQQKAAADRRLGK